MKKIGLLVLLMAAAAAGQTAENATAGNWNAPDGTLPTTASFPIQRVQTPTYADIYCAGFINRQTLPDANYVAGGLQTPQTTKFVRGDVIYMRAPATPRGAVRDYSRFTRHQRIRDVSGAAKLLKSAGQPYEEVGRVRVIDTRSKTAVARSNIRAIRLIRGTPRFHSPRKRWCHFIRHCALTGFCPREVKYRGAL